MRRGVLAVEGGVITSVERMRCSRRPIRITPRIDALRRRAVGQRIEAVERLGKRVLLRLKSQDAIVFEPRMTGLLLTGEPPTSEHLRVHIGLQQAALAQLWYWDRRGLGSVRLFSPHQLQAVLGPKRLGPDALIITPQQLHANLANSRRAIKAAMLDQSVVAAIGNIYASEILHVARIHPQTTCNAISAAKWERLVEATRHVLEQAIRYEGSTLNDGTYRNAQNRNGSYQNHHRVYNRRGRACTTCRRASIQQITLAQRSTFFCPHCQRR